MEGDAVEGSVVCVSNEEVLHTLNEMKTGKKRTFGCTIGVDCS